METYQACFKLGNGKLFPLPVYGTRRNIWDRLANHMHYGSFASWRNAMGFDSASKKSQFVLLKVASNA